ncbi:MAG: glycosyltransferase family 4 protein [Saprospiraceae bacterium]|nr:glycosyltransferase family 4 protein [Saprospiraceae bacterium]
MTIGFDAKRLFHNHTGLGVYSRLLVKGLEKLHPSLEIILFDANPGKSLYKDFETFPVIHSKKILWRSWRMTRDIVKSQCDIFHGLSHELPVSLQHTGVKSVVTIHDVIFLRYPQLYPWPDRKIYAWKWKHSCRIADRIIAVSQQTRADLCHYYQVDEGKIDVIPPPVAIENSAIDLKEFRASENLPSDFLLSVGSLTERKNISLIIEALVALNKEERIPLVIVGTGSQKNKLESLVRKHRLEGMVIFRDHVPTNKLPGYYQAATAFIYPSIYEGFGLPIVESLLNKTPVITSAISAMPEAAGPGALYIDPFDSESLTEAIRKIENDSELRQRLSSDGYQHSLQFAPEVICQKQWEVYKKVKSRKESLSGW